MRTIFTVFHWSALSRNMLPCVENLKVYPPTYCLVPLELSVLF